MADAKDDANIQEVSSLEVQSRYSKAAELFDKRVSGPRESPQKLAFIKINHREAKFILPTGEQVEEVCGFPIYYFRTRRYYKKPPMPGAKGQPPDCCSQDMIVPHDSSIEKQAERCEICPMAQFGTGRDGRSPACGTFTWLFLANTAFKPLPVAALQAPPSSLRVLLGTRFQQGYLGMLEARFKYYEIAWTKFRLKAQGGSDPNGVQYCTLDPQLVRALADSDKDLDVAERLTDLRDQFIAKMNEIRLRPMVEEEEEESVSP